MAPEREGRDVDRARTRPPFEALIGGCLVVAITAAAGWVVVFARGAQVQLEGLLLGVALAGVAVALGVMGKHLMPPGPSSEPRPAHDDPAEARAELLQELRDGRHRLGRRRVLAVLFGAAFAGLGAIAVAPLRSLGPNPSEPLRRTAWRRGTRLVDDGGERIRADRVRLDSFATVYPEGATAQQRGDSQTVLLRLRPGALRARPGREDWTPSGCVAFSKVCTHAGCPVGLYQVETHQLVCPCHQSLFDVTDGARPVFGPATRALPQLPLAVDAEGYLIAADDYAEPIGPGFWNERR